MLGRTGGRRHGGGLWMITHSDGPGRRSGRTSRKVVIRDPGQDAEESISGVMSFFSLTLWPSSSCRVEGAPELKCPLPNRWVIVPHLAVAGRDLGLPRPDRTHSPRASLSIRSRSDFFFLQTL